MLQIYLDQLCEACNHLMAYVDGIVEFENILGRKFIDKVADVESESSWILHDLDFK